MRQRRSTAAAAWIIFIRGKFANVNVIRAGVPQGQTTTRSGNKKGGEKGGVCVVTKQTSIRRETAGYLSIMALLLYDIKNRLMYVAYFLGTAFCLFICSLN